MKMSSALSMVLVMSVSMPSWAGLIPNGDFETGDFTDWQVQTIFASVQDIDGSNRAVISLQYTGDGPGGASGEINSASDPSTWGPGKALQFDLAYEFSTDSVGAGVGIYVNASLSGWQLLSVTQTDSTPLSGNSSLTTYTIPWDGHAFEIFPEIYNTEEVPGNVSLTVILDNVRIIPEPSTWVLAATTLVGVPFFASRRRRR